MRLGDVLRGRTSGERSISTVDDYAAAVSAFGYAGLGYPVGGLPGTAMPEVITSMRGEKSEPIRDDFVGLVQGAYRANGVVFACMLARMLAFSSVRFSYQRINVGKPSELFGESSLGLLEEPWSGGTTQDLLTRTIQDADLSGNSFWCRRGPMIRLRPDWTYIVSASRMVPGLRVDPETGRPFDAPLGDELLGYVYCEGGINSGTEPVWLLPDEVAHFAPIPDPEATYRGMSWLSPIIRQVQADSLMTRHQIKFFEHSATPNMVIKHETGASPEAIKRFDQMLQEQSAGIDNAYRTLNLYPGADATVVGANFEQIDFKVTQGGGETRVAAAARVPPIIVGLSEGLQAATYCLPYDEPVWTPQGPRAIGDVRAGDKVWSYGDGGLRQRAVTWQGQVGTRAVYTIRTKNRVLRATGNHPVLVRRPGSMRYGSNADRRVGVEWRRVDSLHPGDRVVQVMALPEVDTEVPGFASLDFMQWFGAYVGDGSGVGTGAVRVAMPPQDRVRGHYERLTRDLFPAVHVGQEPRGFRFHSVSISAWLERLGVGGTAKSKRVPGWIFELPVKHRLSFLGGLVDSDGYISETGTFTLQLSNRELVEQVKALAVSCGLQVSNLRHVRMSAAGLPQAGAHAWYDAWVFTVSHAQALRPYTADPVYISRLAGDGRRERRGGLDAVKAGLDPEHLGFFTVRSVERGVDEPVYDLTVEGDHSFVASGVVVHNSNYGQARRAFADGTCHPLWGNAAGSFAPLLRRDIDRLANGGRVRLWYDARDVPLLREDAKEAAEIGEIQARTIRTLVDGGYTPESAARAVLSGDYGLLQHTGLFSVQLQKPGAEEPPATTTGGGGSGAGNGEGSE